MPPRKDITLLEQIANTLKEVKQEMVEMKREITELKGEVKELKEEVQKKNEDEQLNSESNSKNATVSQMLYDEMNSIVRSMKTIHCVGKWNQWIRDICEEKEAMTSEELDEWQGKKEFRALKTVVSKLYLNARSNIRKEDMEPKILHRLQTNAITMGDLKHFRLEQGVLSAQWESLINDVYSDAKTKAIYEGSRDLGETPTELQKHYLTTLLVSVSETQKNQPDDSQQLLYNEKKKSMYARTD